MSGAARMRRTARAAAIAASTVGMMLVPVSGPAQEIVQAVLLDLTVVEVQVIVAGTRGDERVRCLVRAAPDGDRAVAERAVASGVTSGRTTMLSLPLPLLGRGEREFSVVLVRGEAVLARTAWRPLR